MIMIVRETTMVKTQEGEEEKEEKEDELETTYVMVTNVAMNTIILMIV